MFFLHSVHFTLTAIQRVCSTTRDYWGLHGLRLLDRSAGRAWIRSGWVACRLKSYMGQTCSTGWGGFREPFFLMFNISPSYLPTFGDDLVEGLGIGCKNGDYPCPQLPEEDWAQKRKRGAGSIAKGGEAKTIQGHAAGSCL